MLKKLIKYDLLADYKKYAVLSIAMVASSVLLLIFSKIASRLTNNYFLQMMTTVLLMVFFVLAIISGAMLMVFSTVRFYKNIVRDEGYLMHTLPVPTWQLIASKFISVYIWFFAIVIVTGICSGIAFGEPLWVFELPEVINEVVSEANEVGGAKAENIRLGFLMIKYFAVLMLLSPFLAMAHIYFSFALGNLFNKSKLGMSVVMYFAIMFAEQMIGSIASVFLSSDTMSLALTFNDGDIPTEQITAFLDKTMLFSTVMSIIFAIGYTIAAERIFAKKLNLE